MFYPRKRNADHIHEKSEAYAAPYVCGIGYYVYFKSSVFCSLAGR